MYPYCFSLYLIDLSSLPILIHVVVITPKIVKGTSGRHLNTYYIYCNLT